MPATTRSKPEIREEASRRLIALLEDPSPNPWNVLRAEIAEVVSDPESAARLAEPVWRALHDLVSTRDDLSRLMKRATEEMASAETFIRGGSARFNSLGILQADGPRIDVLCAIFHERVERAVDALFEVLSEIDRLAAELSAPDDAGAASQPRPGVFDLRRELGRAPTAEEYRDAS